MIKDVIKAALGRLGLLGVARGIRRRIRRPAPHGHDLLMSMIEQLQMGVDRTLSEISMIEVGSTREDLPGQGSTARLASFCAERGIRFSTVDMDPENTRRASETLALYGPDFQAINMKGEEYLAAFEGPVHLCYLDAFDIAHGRHSEERQSRYEEHLGVEINDDACHAMHLDCARALVDKMPMDGLVVIDDCWEEDGMWMGKGHTAIPFLREHGFEIVGSSRTAVALRRRDPPLALS